MSSLLRSETLKVPCLLAYSWINQFIFDCLSLNPLTSICSCSLSLSVARVLCLSVLLQSLFMVFVLV